MLKQMLEEDRVSVEGQIIAGMPLSCRLESAQCPEHDDLSFAFGTVCMSGGCFSKLQTLRAAYHCQGDFRKRNLISHVSWGWNIQIKYEHDQLLVRPLVWLVESCLLCSSNCCFDVPYGFI